MVLVSDYMAWEETKMPVPHLLLHIRILELGLLLVPTASSRSADSGWALGDYWMKTMPLHQAVTDLLSAKDRASPWINKHVVTPYAYKTIIYLYKLKLKVCRARLSSYWFAPHTMWRIGHRLCSVCLYVNALQRQPYSLATSRESLEIPVICQFFQLPYIACLLCVGYTLSNP